MSGGSNSGASSTDDGVPDSVEEALLTGASMGFSLGSPVAGEASEAIPALPPPYGLREYENDLKTLTNLKKIYASCKLAWKAEDPWHIRHQIDKAIDRTMANYLREVTNEIERLKKMNSICQGLMAVPNSHEIRAAIAKQLDDLMMSLTQRKTVRIEEKLPRDYSRSSRSSNQLRSKGTLHNRGKIIEEERIPVDTDAIDSRVSETSLAFNKQLAEYAKGKRAHARHGGHRHTSHQPISTNWRPRGQRMSIVERRSVGGVPVPNKMRNSLPQRALNGSKSGHSSKKRNYAIRPELLERTEGK